MYFIFHKGSCCCGYCLQILFQIWSFIPHLKCSNHRDCESVSIILLITFMSVLHSDCVMNLFCWVWSHLLELVSLSSWACYSPHHITSLAASARAFWVLKVSSCSADTHGLKAQLSSTPPFMLIGAQGTHRALAALAQWLEH